MNSAANYDVLLLLVQGQRNPRLFIFKLVKFNFVVLQVGANPRRDSQEGHIDTGKSFAEGCLEQKVAVLCVNSNKFLLLGIGRLQTVVKCAQKMNLF